ncbi:M4 family metallopeptidase [Flavobacterium sp. H122]|uniref:M4 family metallopeptidase n=1 Tax=Flavobacterium sp. H122 TaxID=2529860 RepID=UPI0010A9BFA2|nr:M4 family metallopeptidase [Flavobacterium sp. H122]
MKKKLLNAKTVFAVSLFSLALNAQTDKNVNERILGENGSPSLITFKKDSNLKNSDFQSIFQNHLGLKTNQAFNKVKSEIDPQGFTHDVYQLYHQGIKVEFSTYTLHSKSGKVNAMSGEYTNIGKVSNRPSLNAQAAFSKALTYIGAKQYLWENFAEASAMNYSKPKGELVILPIFEEAGKVVDHKLAYKFDIYATSPISRGDIYIDALTGEELYYNATIKHVGEHAHGKAATQKSSINLFKANSMLVAANAATRYSGTQTIETSLSGSSYILSENTRGNGVVTLNMKKGTTYSAAVNFTDADNNWTAAEFNNANKDNAALDAHWGAEKTYDYWKNVHGRNSYDNLGTTLKSYVHYANNYDNAYWNGSVMTYGDGSGTYFDALTSIDVAGHEIGHAVCEKTAGLAYQLESGAMNEGFSDIWGACIEYYAAPNKQRWLIGEDIERRSGHLALRSMSNPKSEGQPDTYGGTYWVSQTKCRPSNRNDYCGVHTNSGVLNHWFYILTEGKSGTNDKGSSYSVTGIGIDKAAKIAYRLESVYLSANSTYANARTYGIQAAVDLFGAGSPEVIATTNAFYAVGVGTAYTSTARMSSASANRTSAFSSEIKIYPNPVENILNVSGGFERELSFRVVNLLGQQVLQGKVAGEINVESLTKGMYYIEMNDGDEVVLSQKFIKK